MDENTAFVLYFAILFSCISIIAMSVTESWPWQKNKK